jgi:hypothetical protein
MGQSHVNRRQRERPLRRHRRAVSRELAFVCDQMDLDPPASRRRELVEEAVWLASPWGFRGIDAVLPAERTDLIRAWMFHRLSRVVETPFEIQRMARSLAPAPDDDFCPGPLRIGDPTSAEVAAAHASRRRRRSPAVRRVPIE